MTHLEKYNLSQPLLPYLLKSPEDREMENIYRTLGKYKPFGNSAVTKKPSTNKILDYTPDPDILRDVEKLSPSKKIPSGWGSQIKQDFEEAHPRIYKTIKNQNISGKLGPFDIQAGKVKTPFGKKILGLNASYKF